VDRAQLKYLARCAEVLVLAGGVAWAGLSLAQVAQAPLVGGATVPAGGAVGADRCRGSAVPVVSSSAALRDGELMIRSGYFSDRWEGYVVAYDARAYIASGADAVPLWTASVPAASDRRIYTSSAQTAAAAFEWCALSAAQRMLLNPDYAIEASCPTSAPPILDYLRGDPRHERRNGGELRDRPATVLGDVVNSTPVYSKAADHAYQLAPAASYSSAGKHGYATYRDYVQGKRASRFPIVLFGANDGMIHILDARAGERGGGEIFAYVPRAAYPVLRALADPAYSHAFTVDGPVVEGDVWNGSAWQTVAIGTAGAGAPGIFAIDVTAPGPSMDARNVLWDVTPQDHPSAAVRNGLGRTIGAGVIGAVLYDLDGSASTTPNGAWAFIVGNGYESRNGRAMLLVFDARNGSLIRAIDTGAGGTTSPNGLGAVTPVYDGNRNVVAVYAGDRLGNLWKFDLASSNPSNWKVSNELPAGSPRPLFTASQPGAVRPVHQAPRIAAHPLGGLYVVFGTGRLFELGDLADTQDQGIFVLWDKGQAAPIGFSDIALIRTEEYSTAAGTFRRLRADDLATFDWNRKGFWVRLRPEAQASSGERVVAPLILDGGTLVVSTFAPDGGAGRCGPSGASQLYRIDLAGGFTRGAFGTEGGPTIGRRVEPTLGGYTPLYQSSEPVSDPVRSLSLPELEAMLARSIARISEGEPASTSGTCLHAALTIDGSAAKVATNCAGVMPMRAWRPMK
jgi:type IV pilus assembly protein PilY1